MYCSVSAAPLAFYKKIQASIQQSRCAARVDVPWICLEFLSCHLVAAGHAFTLLCWKLQMRAVRQYDGSYSQCAFPGSSSRSHLDAVYNCAMRSNCLISHYPPVHTASEEHTTLPCLQPSYAQLCKPNGKS